MGSKLKFEYRTRWQDLAARLLGIQALSSEQQTVVETLNNRDQHLEEFLNGVGGAVVSFSQNIVDTASTAIVHNGPGSASLFPVVNLNVPNEDGVDYAVLWIANSHLSHNAVAGDLFSIYGSGQVIDHAPGSGFDTLWAYGSSFQASGDWISLGDNPQNGPLLSGHAQRLERINDEQRGTTIGVVHYANLNDFSNADGYIWKVTLTALLIAGPTGLFNKLDTTQD